MKFLYVALGAIPIMIIIVVTIGVFLPVKHTARVRRTFRVKPDILWSLLNDPQFWATTSVADPRIHYKVLESIPEKRLVRKIVGDELPFGGTWTIELGPVDGGTLISITENGEVYNPLFRVISRFVIGHRATMKKFMGDLNLRFREA